MANVTFAKNNWQESLQAFIHPRVLTMLFFGFSAGLPIILIFGTLGLWLQEAGINKSTITMFSWAALGYSFKFVWAPLIDKLPLPFLTLKLGRRRAWILLSQVGIIASILWMSTVSPNAENSSLTMMAMAAVLLGFSSATQDIVIDAYRIESADKNLQAFMSSAYVAGYRIGMIVSGAGALYLATYFGSTKTNYSALAWSYTYISMAAVMLIGIITTLIIKEPIINLKSKYQYQTNDYLRFLLLFILAIAGFVLVFVFSSEISNTLKKPLAIVLNNSPLASFIIETLRLLTASTIAIMIAVFSLKAKLANPQMVTSSYLEPIKEFFSRYRLSITILLLSLIGLYRISDLVLGVIANVFYVDMGFSKNEIATVAKTFGLIMSIVGGFIGGLISIRFGVMRVLLLGAILTVATNLLFILLAQSGHNITMLYWVISADNLTAGIATTAFIAFLSTLTNVKFTAVQYAIFSSLMTLIPKITGGYSGSIAENFGYETFFLIASLIGVPIIFLVLFASKHLKLEP